jgi:hypothetical protein
MREEREIIGYIVSQRRVSSSLQEEGDGGILTPPGGKMERSPAILQREEMRGRDSNQRREGGIGDIILYIYFRSSLQEEGDGGIMTFTGSNVERSPAILQREEMRGRDGNQRREGRGIRRPSPLDLESFA